MKKDYSFKLVAAIIFAGVIVALAGPSHAVDHPTAAAQETVSAVNHAE